MRLHRSACKNVTRWLRRVLSLYVIPTAYSFHIPEPRPSVQTTFVHRSTIHDRLIPARDQILAVHGPLIVKALLWGFAAVAPRTTSANLADMLGALATRCDAGVVAGWVNGVLFAVCTVSMVGWCDGRLMIWWWR